MNAPHQPPNPPPGVLRRRIINALRHSLCGLAAAWKSEEAVRVELTLCPGLIATALWFAPGGLEAAVLIAAVLLVVVVELINTAIEKTVDRISTERNASAKMIKDVASAAVFVAIVNCVLVWLAVFW